LNRQSLLLCQVINIDKSGGCDTRLTNKLYSSACYIAGFKINVNGANNYLHVLISKDHCL